MRNSAVQDYNASIIVSYTASTLARARVVFLMVNEATRQVEPPRRVIEPINFRGKTNLKM